MLCAIGTATAQHCEYLGEADAADDRKLALIEEFMQRSDREEMAMSWNKKTEQLATSALTLLGRGMYLHAAESLRLAVEITAREWAEQEMTK